MPMWKPRKQPVPPGNEDEGKVNEKVTGQKRLQRPKSKQMSLEMELVKSFLVIQKTQKLNKRLSSKMNSYSSKKI